MAKLTADLLRKLLRYNKRTGVFVRRSNNKRAGSSGQRGYLRIWVNHHSYKASRLAWLYVTGSWPENIIDHKNGNTSDDRFSNLRDTTHKVNAENQKRAKCNNHVGVLGVHKSVCGKKFRASIKANGKTKHLGTFLTKERAGKAYLDAKKIYHLGAQNGQT